MDSNRQMEPRSPSDQCSLLASACRSLNRCNLPALVLGSLACQAHPISLEIEGVHALHAELFTVLTNIGSHTERARRFMDYMTVHFRLDRLEDMGGLGAG
jgi:NAD+--dinitrogen-reductase ADP-D-ribosyltransferase